MYKENKIVSLVSFGFFAAACFFTVKTVAGDARLFPVIACVLGMAFSAALFLHTCINERLGVPVFQSKKNSHEETVKVLAAFALMLAYTVLITVIGWVTSSVLFMAAFCIYFGGKDKIRTTIISLVTVAVLYILFAAAMNTVLPKGLLI